MPIFMVNWTDNKYIHRDPKAESVFSMRPEEMQPVPGVLEV